MEYDNNFPDVIPPNNDHEENFPSKHSQINSNVFRINKPSSQNKMHVQFQIPTNQTSLFFAPEGYSIAGCLLINRSNAIVRVQLLLKDSETGSTIHIILDDLLPGKSVYVSKPNSLFAIGCGIFAAAVVVAGAVIIRHYLMEKEPEIAIMPHDFPVHNIVPKPAPQEPPPQEPPEQKPDNEEENDNSPYPPGWVGLPEHLRGLPPSTPGKSPEPVPPVPIPTDEEIARRQEERERKERERKEQEEEEERRFWDQGGWSAWESERTAKQEAMYQLEEEKRLLMEMAEEICNRAINLLKEKKENNEISEDEFKTKSKEAEKCKKEEQQKITDDIQARADKITDGR